jgi:imidazolonepropionase-like amidohydrolase
MYTWVLAHSGIPRLEALRSATLLGAEVLGLEQDFGSPEVGKPEGVIVLSRNPLERIEFAINLHAVLFNGRLYDAATLDERWPRVRKGPASR